MNMKIISLLTIKEFDEKKDLAEAKAFSDRIKLRVSKGFISDLRDLKKTNHFIKAFGDTHVIKIYGWGNVRLLCKNFKSSLKKGSNFGFGMWSWIFLIGVGKKWI